MFRILLCKEIHDSLMSLRFAVSMILCIVLIPLAMYINLQDYEKRLRSYEQSVALYQQDHTRARDVAGGAKGFRAPSMLSIFSIGLEYHLPTTLRSDRQDGISYSNDRGLDNPQSLLFGKIDLTFIVSFVLSLLALLFMFNSITGEKEMGTLKLALSNTVPRHHILLSKVLGNYLVLSIPFIISLLIGSIIVLFSGKISLFSAGILPQFMLMVLISLLFIAVFFNLGILFSSLTQRSSTAIVVLLLLWVFYALAFPKISTMLAEVVYPVKSDMVVALQKSVMLKSLEDEERAEYTEIWRRVGDGGPSPSASLDTTQWRPAISKFMAEREVVEKKYVDLRKSGLSRLEQQHILKKQGQSSIAVTLSRFSPVSCFIYSMSTLARTGLMEESVLYDDADRFEEDMQKNIYDRIFTIKFKSSTSNIYNFEGNDPPPHFHGSPLTRSVIFKHAWLDVVLLCLYNILFFSLSYIAFLKYDIR